MTASTRKVTGMPLLLLLQITTALASLYAPFYPQPPFLPPYTPPIRATHFVNTGPLFPGYHRQTAINGPDLRSLRSPDNEAIAHYCDYGECKPCNATGHPPAPSNEAPFCPAAGFFTGFSRCKANCGKSQLCKKGSAQDILLGHDDTAFQVCRFHKTFYGVRGFQPDLFCNSACKNRFRSQHVTGRCNNFETRKICICSTCSMEIQEKRSFVKQRVECPAGQKLVPSVLPAPLSRDYCRHGDAHGDALCRTSCLAGRDFIGFRCNYDGCACARCQPTNLAVQTVHKELNGGSGETEDIECHEVLLEESCELADGGKTCKKACRIKYNGIVKDAACMSPESVSGAGLEQLNSANHCKCTVCDEDPAANDGNQQPRHKRSAQQHPGDDYGFRPLIDPGTGYDAGVSDSTGYDNSHTGGYRIDDSPAEKPTPVEVVIKPKCLSARITQCSAACNGGIYYVTQQCGDVFTKEVVPCNPYPCPVDCEVGTWSAWSACSAPCGPLGTTYRWRQVIIPPLYGGRGCPNPLSQSYPCNRGVKCADPNSVRHAPYGALPPPPSPPNPQPNTGVVANQQPPLAGQFPPRIPNPRLVRPFGVSQPRINPFLQQPSLPQQTPVYAQSQAAFRASPGGTTNSGVQPQALVQQPPPDDVQQKIMMLLNHPCTLPRARKPVERCYEKFLLCGDTGRYSLQRCKNGLVLDGTQSKCVQKEFCRG